MSETNGVCRIRSGEDEYKLGRVGFYVKVQAEEKLREIRQNDFKQTVSSAVEKLEHVQAASLVITAFNTLMKSGTIHRTEVSEWLMSHSGTLFIFWKSLLVHNPSITEQQAQQVFENLSEDEYRKMDEFLLECVFPSSSKDPEPAEAE
jgi:uncharacterized protein YbcC (UPF0753/DUF2309 family)